MKKTIGIILAIAVIVVIIVVATRGGDKAPSERGGSEQISGTFADLARLGKNFQCTFAQEDEDTGSISGTVYVADQKVRGTYEWTDLEGSVSEFEIIRDDEFNYIWGESTFGSMALKTRIAEDEAEIDSEAAQDFDATEEELDFDCKRWKPDQGKFIPPTSVDFNEFTLPTFDLSGGTVEVGASANMDICATCDALPEGDTRDQCLEGLAQLGCN